MSPARLDDAIAQLRNGRIAEAARICKSLLKADRGNQDALYILAVAEMQNQRFHEADELLARLLALNPKIALAWANRGNARIALKDPEGAVAAFDGAIAAEPMFVEAHFNRAKLLKDLGRLEDALAGYDRCLALAPAFVDALMNRGNVLGMLGRHAEALACYDQCLALQPGLLEAHYNRGNVLMRLGRHEEARASYGRAVALNPAFSEAYFARCHAKIMLCDWTDFATENERIKAAIEKATGPLPAFHLLARLSAAEQLRSARSHVAQTCPPSEPLWRGERYAHERIRLAYLSADFRDHPVALLTAGLFEQHERSRFEVVGISFGRDDASPVRGRLKKSFDRFIEVQAMSDEDIARLLREHEIDIAVDLNGFTSGGRPAVFARRPAPVQVNYLGYAGTLGSDHWDYIIADRFVVPDEDRRHFAEKVVQMPHTFMVNDGARKLAERVPSRPEAGLPETGFVFCCFNNAFKITPDAFDVWMRLLRQVEGSVLWLSNPNANAAGNLRQEAEARGVAAERLIFAPKMALNEDHLARMRLADLFIDTFHFNAHATAADALWAGVPVLTCSGATFASRVAGSLLGAVGLPELVTHSPQDYAALALRLARDRDALSGVRQTLARNRDRLALFDTKRFARHLEAAYIRMWELAQAGARPQAFALTPSEAS